MPHELPKAYEPGSIEARWAEYWIKEKLFSAPTPPPGETRPVFTLLLPPPNVTGRLHMGHMLNQTQMDIIVRWHRMRGFLTLWLPGTDHAGIATQMMVERQLAKEGKSRRKMGREAFVERVWEWKRHYGGAILEQMKRLGASVDWDREYFTMDDNLSHAVREVFVRLYEEGLIYRGKYIVNWCPRCGTAISDLEVKHEDVSGKLYEIRYPVIGEGFGAVSVGTREAREIPLLSGEFITVATTRPETMLGDTAVAVNEKDQRYLHLHGKKVLLPLMNREIPIILDEIANPEFGTGAVKITPAHDPNDFQAGLRHDLPQINVMDERGHMNENAGPYAGLDRFAAREKVIEDLKARGFFTGEKDHTIPIAKCDRCNTIVEPRLSTQWFIKIKPLAEAAIRAVESGEITIVPENFKTIYLNWMNNIHDWCISRQLWWGHRIPVWHCALCKGMVVARQTPAQCTECGGKQLEQDTDVLDTWFSSGLLPFTTLGWPEKTRDQEVFYPTTLLITAYEILFFWVSRMIMFGCHFMAGHHQDPVIKAASGWADKKDDSVPFRNVYIHALVRDAERQKMSKTKGNVIDPLEIIGHFGTDATRFTLASMAAPGTDIAFSESRTNGYRAFANKIWNASRLMFMNLDRVGGGILPQNPSASPGVAGFEAKTLEDRWILSRFQEAANQVHFALTSYRFDNAANAIYDFFWGELCDWYLELIKPRLMSENADIARVACVNLVNLLEAALRLLHPIMPFITEELWQAVYDGNPPFKSIALAPYPGPTSSSRDTAAEMDMAVVRDLIVSVRNLRAELKVDTKVKVPIEVFAHQPQIRAVIERSADMVQRLANVDGASLVDHPLANRTGARSTARFDVHVVYERKIDVAAERDRLKKELEQVEKQITNKERQLDNQQFLGKAPPNIVEDLRRGLDELKILHQKTRNQLNELGNGNG